MRLVAGEQSMDKHLVGTWEEFEAWVRSTIGSYFRWRIRPLSTRSNREMIVSLILDEIRRNNGVFPEKDAFIERLSDAGPRTPSARTQIVHRPPPMAVRPFHPPES